MTKSFEQVKKIIESNGDALFHCYLPVTRHIVKKNRRPIRINRRTGNRFIGKSDELASAEINMTNLFRRSMLKHPGFKSIDKPVWCVFLFYFPETDFVVKNGPRKGQISGRLPDLSNLLELPADALQKAGVIENDRQICSFDLSRRLPGRAYGLEVFIFEYELENKNHLQLVP